MASSPTLAPSAPTPASPRQRGRRWPRATRVANPPGQPRPVLYNRSMGEPLEIRAATDGDLEQVNDLYNHYVRESHVTFDVVPITLAARREWFSRYGTTGRYRLLVATTSTTVLGYASSSP